jgi:hypothetical protein
MCVEILCSSCFRSCESLRDVQFESNSQLRRIESYAFLGCSSLESILLPASLNTIDGSAFASSGLSEIKISEGCSSFQIEDNFVTDFGRTSLIIYFGQCDILMISSHYSRFCNKCFSSCKSLRDVQFESNSQLRRIESAAFLGCWSLESIFIPMCVEILCSECFGYCKSLRNVQFESNSQLRRIESRAFFQCSSLRSIFLPPAVEIIWFDCFDGCGSLYMVTFSPY